MFLAFPVRLTILIINNKKQAHPSFSSGDTDLVFVLRRGDDFEILAVNRLEDTFSASPAIVGDEIYLRGQRYLYAIGASGEPTSRSDALAGQRAR